jgi:hypothetical protein
MRRGADSARVGSPDEDNQIALTALTSRDDWSGSFAVIESDRIRVRPLPEVDAEK